MESDPTDARDVGDFRTNALLYVSDWSNAGHEGTFRGQDLRRAFGIKAIADSVNGQDDLRLFWIDFDPLS